MHGVAPQMCRSGSPSIVRRRSRRSLPRLHLKLNDPGSLPGSGGGSLRRKETARNGGTTLRTGGNRDQLVRMAFAWLMAVAVASAI